MSDDLISRAAAFDSVEIFLKQTDAPEVYPGLIPALERVINNVPSAQPEIVTCKDCRWRKDQSGSTAWLPCRAIVTPSDFYCGRAERRTDEGD